MNERADLEDLALDGRVILKSILTKQDEGVKIGLILLREMKSD